MTRTTMPIWFPKPNAWFNALLLSMVMTGFAILIKETGGIGYNLTKWAQTPEVFTVSFVFLLILPIPAIAFLHHFLLGRFIPTMKNHRENLASGFLPGVVSWWSSLYSWLVFLLSTLIAILICTPFLPLFKINYSNLIYGRNLPNSGVQILFVFCWLTIAAAFYHLHSLAKRRLSTGAPVFVRQPVMETVAASTSGETQIQPTEIAQEAQPTVIQPEKKRANPLAFIFKQKNLVKNLVQLVVIGLVAAWIYSFVNLPQVQQGFAENTANPIQFANPLVPAQVKPQVGNSVARTDSFMEAVKLAEGAADLAKSANSIEEWNLVVGKWQAALSLMKSVPSDSPNYVVAESKIVEYQINLDSAQRNASKAR